MPWNSTLSPFFDSYKSFYQKLFSNRSFIGNFEKDRKTPTTVRTSKCSKGLQFLTSPAKFEMQYLNKNALASSKVRMKIFVSKKFANFLSTVLIQHRFGISLKQGCKQQCKLILECLGKQEQKHHKKEKWPESNFNCV